MFICQCIFKLYLFIIQKGIQIMKKYIVPLLLIVKTVHLFVRQEEINHNHNFPDMLLDSEYTTTEDIK